MTNRRQFLAASAAAAVAGPLAAQPPATGQPAATQSAIDFGGFTVGIQTYTFRQFSLERALEQIRDLGIRNVELFRGHVPTNSTDEQIRAFRAVLDRYSITPVAFGVENFGTDHDANRRLFEFGWKLGIRYLTADPDPRDETFQSLDRLVGEYGIGIAIHPHGPVGNRLHRWYSAQTIMNAVRAHNRQIGSCLDTGHLIRSAQAPFNERLDSAAQIRAMGARNFGLHLKDHDNARRTDVVFGRGVLDVPGILAALREVKFRGYIAVEYEANPENPTADVRACLEVLRTAARRPA